MYFCMFGVCACSYIHAFLFACSYLCICVGVSLLLFVTLSIFIAPVRNIERAKDDDDILSVDAVLADIQR